MVQRVRVIPLPKDATASVEEVWAALREPPSARHLQGPSGAMPDYLVGTPAFRLPFRAGVTYCLPVGQYHLARPVLKAALNRGTTAAHLAAEYRAMIQALIELGVSFRILNLDAADPTIRAWLVQQGCGAISFPVQGTPHWTVYPRDMFVCLEAIGALLVHSELFQLRPRFGGRAAVTHTTWAEGGKVLFSGRRMLVSRHPEKSHPRETNVIAGLRERGMKVGVIPYPLFCDLSDKGEAIRLSYNTHLDRIASLLTDEAGGCHLVIDPGYRTGLLTDPLSAHKSIDLVRRACEKTEVQVHTPQSLSVPYATSAVQFHDGRVLTTSGDPEVLGAFAQVVGPKKLKTTSAPVVFFPVFACAGLHCLIAENPDVLLSRR